MTQGDQPMFSVNIAGRVCYLPSEFCLIDGIPDSLKKGPGMRDALAKTRINPEDKLDRIRKMV